MSAFPSGDITVPFILTCLAGLSTCVGSLLLFSVKKFKNSYLTFCLGLSSGAMMYISFMELLPEAQETLSLIETNLFFFLGIGIMMLIDFVFPHQYLQEREGLTENQSIFSTGLLTAAGVAIHNIPEGMAVFISGMVDIHIGVALAIAIAAHNIPEGIAVAAPIYYATGSKAKAFLYSFFSGVAEPLGAVLMLILFKDHIDALWLARIFAIVSGIMVFICLDELLPQTFNKDFHKQAISGILCGFLVIFLSLTLA